ncbi:MAG: hypothetical protein GTO40_00900, partial [Deltaproteobacteria bacterium]|nr:hypothetical protein [Deltaproteobacteria bacterium]
MFQIAAASHNEAANSFCSTRNLKNFKTSNQICSGIGIALHPFALSFGEENEPAGMRQTCEAEKALKRRAENKSPAFINVCNQVIKGGDSMKYFAGFMVVAAFVTLSVLPVNAQNSLPSAKQTAAMGDL